MVRTRTTKLHIGHRCLMCDDMKKNGLHVFDAFLCAMCEQEIVNLDVKTQIYDRYVMKVRTVSSFLNG